VVVWSRDSVASSWVREEADDKELVPTARSPLDLLHSRSAP
jgi:hypothetical protein